jgi:nitric oxide reductase subunit B
MNGYWHARGLDYLNHGYARLIEWYRLPGDLIFIFLGVVPLVIATCMTYLSMRKLLGRGTVL